MPAWLVTILLKYVLPLVISWLEKEGYLNAAEAIAAKGATAVVNEVKSLKTYQDYPIEPGIQEADTPSKNNLTETPPS